MANFERYDVTSGERGQHPSRFETDEFMEMAIKWAKGEMNSTQLRDAIGNKNYSGIAAIGLRRAVRQGRLVEPKTKR
jgi:hypothetical protein